MRDPRGVVLLVWWFTCLIWSSVWLFIKVGVNDVPPLGFAAMRLAIAAPILLLIVLASRAPLPAGRRDWLVVLGTGVLILGFNYGLLYWGTQFISSGVTAVLQASTPAFSLAFARLAGTERLTTRKVAGILLGVAGVAVICLDQLRIAGWSALAGSAAATAGAACVAVGYVSVKAWGGRIASSTLMAGQMFAALVPLAAMSVALEGSPLAFRWTTTAVVSLLYLTFAGSILGAGMNYWLLRRMDATGLLSMGFVEPLIAVLLGAAFLDERLAARTVAGGIAVLASVWIILRER